MRGIIFFIMLSITGVTLFAQIEAGKEKSFAT